MSYELNTTLHQPSNVKPVEDVTMNGQYRGLVMRKDRGRYEVLSGEKIIACAVSNRIHKQLIYPTAAPTSLSHRVQKVITLDHVDPLAVGDMVQFTLAGDGSGVITEFLPRCNKLTRRTSVPMPTANPFEQVIVANVDLVAPVFAAANPPPKWNMLDRYLVSAESLGLHSLIIITKTDLAPGQDDHASSLDEAVKEYRTIGYPVLMTSTVSGMGLPEIRELLKDKITVFVGKSGVGKTSLLNAVQPELGLKVKAVSEATGKGRHTTTNLEMFSLDFGGAVVDTPGMREFGLWETQGQDLALFFPEMSPFVGKCKFGLDCQHDKEPGCAIRKAVSDGSISQRRYQSFLSMGTEDVHGK